ncbi:hypothetical protein BS17DRAFT_780463 [Gyrodon lividus]|nr:hypothetical protein BS17DRAFT_780463 [Gyrodon lividus]
MSFNVLFGRKHTHYDDLESFLYVLLLFFFSYAGPLSNDELRDADERGFVQCLGSGRLTHMRRWPDKYAMWADGDLSRVAESKDSSLGRETGSFDLIRSAEVRHCLKSNWPAGLHGGIVTLLFSCWSLFANSRISPRLNLPRTQVTHRQFIGRLDDWLDKFSGIEDEFSNCPFNNESL